MRRKEEEEEEGRAEDKGDAVASRNDGRSLHIKANDESDGGYESRCKNKATLSLPAASSELLNLS